MNNCGTCKNAIWSRTPTGRIKKGVPGKCSKASEILLSLNVSIPPCISLTGGYFEARIWPEYPADSCADYSFCEKVSKP